MSQNPKLTVVELSTEAVYELAGIIREFVELFGREPEPEDYALGLATVVTLKRDFTARRVDRLEELRRLVDALPL